MIQNNNKKTMLLLLAVFILPVILAKLALEMDFFNKGVTNKGQLLPVPIELADVLKKEEPVWRLVYSIPNNCDAVCENSLYSVNQIWQALGRQQDRVESTILFTPVSDQKALSKVQENQHFAVFPIEEERLTQAFNDYSLADVYIADTLGNVILSYQIPNDQEQAVMESRDILADIKKLLKLSRIG